MKTVKEIHDFFKQALNKGKKSLSLMEFLEGVRES